MLPAINTPEFETQLPSSGKTVKYRPFLVKEEKVLFMALEGGEISEISNAVTRVLNACTNNAIKAEELPFFDVEYLFLQLRSKSIGEVVELNLRHLEGECKHVTPFSLNIDQIKVEKRPGHTDKIQLTDQVGVKLKYPTLKSQSKLQSVEELNNIEKLLEFIADSIDVVYDQNNVYDNFTPEEAKTFVEGLNKLQFEKIMDFYLTMPKLSHTIEYKCPQCSKQEKLRLEGLSSFFA